MSQYRHTYGGWATLHYGSWQNLINRLPSKKHILEIGCFEGQSTCWFADNALEHPESTLTCIDTWSGGEEHARHNPDWSWETVESNFLYNISQTKYPEKIRVCKGQSHEMLAKLLLEGNKYDLIYVDGSHKAFDVLIDGALSFKMLTRNGFALFDDYDNAMATKDKTLRPRMGVDAIVNALGYRAESSRTRTDQFWIRKIQEP